MNFIWGLVFLFTFFGSFAAIAETHYLLVDPGTSPTSNYYRYYNDVRRAYETLVSQGKKPHVFAKNGSWVLQRASNEKLLSFGFDKNAPDTQQTSDGKVSYPPISGPAKNVSDFVSSIKALNPKEGDSVVFYITAHGGPPRSHQEPATATILAWQSETTFSEIADAIKTLPPGVKIKLVTTTCYGGGIHSLARSLPNVCTASTIPHTATSYSGRWDEFLFNQGLWNEFRSKKGNLSFAEAMIGGFKVDFANRNLGTLSSFDFVDFVLEKGPYEKNFSWFPTHWTKDERDGEESQRQSPPADYKPSLLFTASIHDPLPLPKDIEAGTCTDCCTNPVQRDIAQIERLAKTLNEIAQQAVVQDLGKKEDRQPAQVRTIFHDVIDDMKKNGAKYLVLSIEYDRKFQDLKRRWDEAKRKSGDDWRKEGRSRSQMQKEFDGLKANAERDLKQYSFNHQMLERLDRLEEFNKKATAEQKRKFTQLLQCEWEPL